MNDFPVVEDLLTFNILLYDMDFVNVNIIGELAWRSKQKLKNTVRLLIYNKDICHVSNINASFQSFRSSNCDIFFSKEPSIRSEI